MMQIFTVLLGIIFHCLSLYYTTCFDTSTTLSLYPLFTYVDILSSRKSIWRENSKKSGVYRWVHKESGKSYVGSSVNLGKRFNLYYNYKHISNPKHNMNIHKALLKYGYVSFTLEILEHCDRDIITEREQLYIDTIKPEYNILRFAYSSLDFKHRESSKKLMSELAKGRIISKETILKMKQRKVSEVLKARLSAFFKNRKVSDKTRELQKKARLGRKASLETLIKSSYSSTNRQPVVLTELNTGVSKEFPSMISAGKYLGISRTAIRCHLTNNKPYKNHSISPGKV